VLPHVIFNRHIGRFRNDDACERFDRIFDAVANNVELFVAVLT
jgi:hypothetical protein